MDASRFDVWTRRRVGLATGGAVAALLGLSGFQQGESRKKKKRCRKLGKTCKKRGKKRQCCGSLKCDAISSEPSTQTRCCKSADKACTDNLDCCAGLCCGPTGVCQDVCFSDRNLKANFGSVDPVDMLQRVRELPISTWNYTSDDASVRHIGPMAQDFAASFGVGADDRHIHPIDGQGIALAAIQGLVAELERLREENSSLADRVAALEQSRS